MFVPGNQVHFSTKLLKSFMEKNPFEVESLKFPISAIIKVPARVGFCVRDMATFGKLEEYKGKVGGGGFGMAVNLFTTTKCTVLGLSTDANTSCAVNLSCAREAVARHHIEVFRRCLAEVGASQTSFSVVLEHTESFKQHCGLGSTSSLALGVYFGLNECFGKPFTDDDIREMLACNYVEEAHNDANNVMSGYETTMTATGAIGGGAFLIDPNDLHILTRNTVNFKELPVFLVAPPAIDESVESLEKDTLTEGAVTDSAFDEQRKKQHIFDHILLPELQSDTCDLDKIGAAVYALNNSGGKRVEIEKKGGRAILNFLNDIKSKLPNAVIAGMSSIGPMVAVVGHSNWSDSDSKLLSELCENRRCTLFASTTVNTTGYTAETIKWPNLVIVVGQPFAGKSSFCKAMVERSPDTTLHFSAGQEIRDEIAHNPNAESTKILEKVVTSGKVEDVGGVFTRVLVQKLCQKVTSSECSHLICLLDGFPRSEAQFTVLVQDYGVTPNRLLNIITSEEIRNKRAADRPARGVEEPTKEERDRKDQSLPLVYMADKYGINVITLVNEGEIEAIVNQCVDMI